MSSASASAQTKPKLPLGNTVFRGTVMHKRLKPFVHKLDYSVFSICVDIDALGDLDRSCRLFAHNRFAPISLHDRDYGTRDGTPIRQWVDSVLTERGMSDTAGQPVRLLTFPRLWGFVFNPLSIYFCYDESHALRAILYEVSNTFGQSHSYLLPIEGAEQGIKQETDKVFHVSPFIEMGCRYHFRLRAPDERLLITIQQNDAKGDPLLIAKHTAQGDAFSDANLASAILRNPLMTAKVIGGIHWEALKLWLKGARFYKKPALPATSVTGPSTNT